MLRCVGNGYMSLVLSPFTMDLYDQVLTLRQQCDGMQKCHLFIFNENADGLAFWRSTGWTLRTDVGILSKIIEPVVLEHEA